MLLIRYRFARSAFNVDVHAFRFTTATTNDSEELQASEIVKIVLRQGSASYYPINHFPIARLTTSGSSSKRRINACRRRGIEDEREKVSGVAEGSGRRMTVEKTTAVKKDDW